MAWSFTPVSYIYIQTALIAASVAFFAWRRRKTLGASPLAGLLLAAALWATMEAAENAAPTLEFKIAASKVSHIGIQSLPVFFFTFCAALHCRHSGCVAAAVSLAVGGAGVSGARRLH